MKLREIVFKKLKEQNKLDLWPQVRTEIFSMENQGVTDKYIELIESGYKCKNTINSWVAYILGICDDEPKGDMKIVKTPKLADIDSDFDKERRDEVIALVEQHFGPENVSHIATYGQYKLKMAIQSILKYKMAERGEDPNAAIAISSNIPYTIEMADVPFEQKLDLALEESPELAIYLNKYPEERELIEKIIGAYSNISMHAAGIVIGPQPIYQITPIAATSKGPVTAMDKYDIEAMGLVKFDFLGLANITTISNCLKLIKERHGKDINLIQDINLNDQKCLARFDAGDVDTVFQFETPSFQEILTNQVKVDNFDDLIIIVAINRPGPKKFISDKFYDKYSNKIPDKDGNVDPPVSPIGTYASNKKNPDLIHSPHPSLKSILKETYGIPVYQEQIMRMVQVLSGASMADADKLRDAIGKKKMGLFAKCVESFAKGCKLKGIDDGVISEVTALIQKFGKYGFNKAHATAYAVLGFWNMWFKTYYPAEWYAAVFTTEFSETNSKNKMLQPCYSKGTNVAGKYSQEFKSKLEWYVYGASIGGFNGKFKKVDVFTPSLNMSHYQKAIIAKGKKGEEIIYLPFAIIEGLGSNMLSVVENRKLLPNQKYNDMKQFVEYSGVSEKLAMKLVDNGVLEDDFGKDVHKIQALLTYYFKVRQEERKNLQQRERKTSVKIDDNIQKELFGDFLGINSIQFLNEMEFKPLVKTIKKNDKEITLEDKWF